mmetsp:Transcript_134956/g.238734  ORF Transcript_134956/g.238734 Transcript_134956/m.238734 type:complete len:568 (-) Transcript_134956:6-1709(-)
MASGTPSAPPPTRQSRCKAVAAAIGSTSLPDACRRMLVAGLDGSLGVPSTERDCYQVGIVGYIGKALADQENDLKAHLEECQVNMQRAQRAFAPHSDAEGAAKDKLAATEEVEKGKRRALEAAAGEAIAAERAHKEADAVLKQAEGELLEAELERDESKKGCAMLKEGAAMDDQLVATLGKICAKIGLEESLVIALPGTAKKTLEHRSKIDALAADMIVEALEKHQVELEQKMSAEEGSAALTQQIEVVAKKQEALVEAEEHREAQAAKVHAAEMETKQVRAEVENIRRQADEPRTRFETAVVKLEESKERLHGFLSGAFWSYFALRTCEEEAEKECATKFEEAKQHQERVYRDEEERHQREVEDRANCEAKAEEEAKEEARVKAEEESRVQAEMEAKQKAAAEAARLQAEEDARLKAEEEARVQAEVDARQKAEEEAEAPVQGEVEAEQTAEAANPEAEIEAKEEAEEEAPPHIAAEASPEAEPETMREQGEVAREELLGDALYSPGKDDDDDLDISDGNVKKMALEDALTMDADDDDDDDLLLGSTIEGPSKTVDAQEEEDDELL